MCGEKTVMVKGQERHLGSSPRMRGKVNGMAKKACLRRITPAYAGKSPLLSVKQPLLTDHPRMCGEKRICTGDNGPHLGSPPHVRGKEYRAQSIIRSTGITPACAGKSRSKLPVDSREFGSPPHVRGKGHCTSFTDRRVGITPACAGKRPRGLLRKTAVRDHPRMCGEKPRPDRPSPGLPGSPPHVRGKD